jgi:urocanate hydratase
MYQELIHHIETSNIYDGSRFTADMAIQNVIGDSFRGATWVSIHNGGGVEVINGGFGMVLDGTKEASRRLASMLSGMLTTESQEGVGLVTKEPFLL